MKNSILIIFTFLILVISAQEPVYFNNIYTYNGNYTIGMTVIDNGEGYFGYGATDDVGIYQMLFLYKLSYSGEMQILKTYYEPNYTFYPGIVGGAMIETWDNKLALAYHYSQNGSSYGALMKLDNNLDTIWKKSYTPSYMTATLNCIEGSDKCYLLTGWVFQSAEDYSDAILLKTDSLGNYQWHQLYGGFWAEHGTDVIETPDGGYLIGGYFWKPGYDHSQDAMVIKTDSLGNEEWTKYYGNPDVDDDMAFVSMADDGNYLVATIYGEWDYSSTYRIGRPCVYKINSQGQIIEQIKVGPDRMANYIKNFRQVNDAYILTGFSYETDTTTMALYTGWMMKLDLNLDSIWYRDYTHYNQLYDDNYLYDINICQDKGYIGIGKARPDQGGSTNKMWIVKVDSMGCDTPGCFTTVISEEYLVNSEGTLRVWPNPTENKFEVRSSKFEVGGTKIIRLYNSQGLKVEEIMVPDGVESMEVDVSNYTNGLYYLQYIQSNQIVETVKFIKN